MPARKGSVLKFPIKQNLFLSQSSIELSQSDLTAEELLIKIISSSQDQAKLIDEYASRTIKITTNAVGSTVPNFVRNIDAENVVVEHEKNRTIIYVPLHKVLEVCGSMGVFAGVAGLLSWLLTDEIVLQPIICVFLVAASPFYYWMGRHIRSNCE
jgi:hypothetical protein